MKKQIREDKKIVFRETTVGRKFTHDDAQKLVSNSMRYDSDITLEMGNKKINAKSLMGVISMVLGRGDTVTVIVTGDDQEEALTGTIKQLSAK